MKDIWVLTVKTSLPDTCSRSADLTTTCRAFDSFEKAREALRETVKGFAFSKNRMFDGDGHITHLNRYADAYANDVYEEDEQALDSRVLRYVIDSLREAFAGNDVAFATEQDYYTDWMIAIRSNPGEVTFFGEDDGPCNGFDPDICTNIFSMQEEQPYYLYIDDYFGQDACTSELYIDLQKASLE